MLRLPAPDLAVRSVTISLTIAAIVYVFRFVSDAPVMDEWDIVPQYAEMREAGDGAWWIVARHNEHRYPAARIVYVAVMEATGFDFRSGMVVSAFFLGLSAVVLADAVRRLRGRTAWGDVLIPALLLHWGHGFNLLMSYQLAFSLFVLSATGFIWLVVVDRRRRSWDVAAGGMLLWLMLQGGMGIGLVPPVAVWLACRAWSRRKEVRWAWCALTAGLPITVAMTYFVWAVTGVDPVRREWGPWVITATGQFTATGLGLWVREGYWPFPWRSSRLRTSARSGCFFALFGVATNPYGRWRYSRCWRAWSAWRVVSRRGMPTD